MGKIRKWLYDYEAKSLGLEVRPNQKHRNQARYCISKDDWQNILLKRQNKTLSLSGKSTLRDSEGNIVLEWTKTNVTQEDKLNALKEAINALKEDIQPTNPTKIINNSFNDNLINQYTLTDFHLGMMAWREETGNDWDLKTAEQILINFFKVGIENSPNAKECIFANIGDFLHWDGLDAVTPTSHHILDADTRFTKLVRVAIRLIRQVIKMLLEKYEKVTLIMAEGNHDLSSSVWLREVFSSFYENEPRLVIDTNADIYYCKTFGDVCLFYHHGHKRNLKNLDSVFVSKFKKQYGDSKHVYAHTGHLHHEHKVESNLMILEQHRTLSGKDAHASRGGYNSGRDSKVITYHKNYGEVARQTINIDMLL